MKQIAHQAVAAEGGIYSPEPAWRSSRAFSLVEVLVACTILALLLGLVLSIVGHTGEVWRKTNARIEVFKGARNAFNNLTRLVEQATLNTYWDYDDPNQPSRYIRRSELHFRTGLASDILVEPGEYSGQAVFFQAPANVAAVGYRGVEGLLSACGFYIQYGSDAAWLPAHIAGDGARNRFRLFQWIQNSETMEVYSLPDSQWIKPGGTNGAFPVAENVITMVVWPAEEGGQTSVLDSYSYDSRANANAATQPATANQLPPVFQVALVAMDEASAQRLGGELKATVEGCLNGLFQGKPSVTFASDLAKLEERLAAKKIQHHVFFSSIAMREAKWSPQP